MNQVTAAIQTVCADEGCASRTLWARYGKRVCDLIGAAVLMLLLLPLLLVAGLAVKLTSPGAMFFSQARAGRGGRVFRIWKFRTMRAGRVHDLKEIIPLSHPEVTPVGRVLRRTKVDELPQLYSVLIGDMSLIGPRPALPEQAAAYDAFRRQRLLVRPGMTGLAQVNSNAQVSWDERILYDIVYVRRCGLLMDLGIVLRTIVVLLFSEARTTRPFRTSPYGHVLEVPADIQY